MTRSLTKKLFTPYEEPERVLHSTMKLFKTTSLDYLSSSEFDLFSNLEDQCKEEVAEAIGEPTMEEYMTKTREDYGSGIARPKIDEKARFELKGQFLKELRDNTFSGSDNEDANEHIQKVANAKKAIQDMADHSQKWHNGMSTRTRSTDTSNRLAAIQAQLNNLGRKIKKVNEIVYAAQVGCESCGGPHYTKDCPLKAAATGFYQRDHGNPSYQERRQTMEESLSKFMAESAKKHVENSNLIMEIQASTDASIRNQGASIKALEIQIRQMSKVLQEKGFGSLPGLTETNPRDHVKSISTTIEADTSSSHYAVSSPLDTHYEEKEVLGELIDRRESATDLKRLFKEKSRMGYQIEASMNVHDSTILEYSLPPKKHPGSESAHTKLIIELADRTIKHPKGIAENVLVGIDKFVFPRVYVLGLREQMELDLEATLMGEALILNRSPDPTYENYIDLNEPLELRRNQVEDLGFEHVNANFFPILSTNVMSKRFYNSIMKDKIMYRGKNVLGASMNVPIFVGNFSIMTNFAVVENMDAYQDHDMGEVIVGKPFCREIYVKERRFDGMITIVEVIIEQRVKVNQKARILKLKQRNHEEHCSDILYAISIKEDTAYPCPELHSTSMKERSIRLIQMKPYVVFKYKSWNILEYNNHRTHDKKPQYVVLDPLNTAYRLNSGLYKYQTLIQILEETRY
ncbi:hypothetical protein Tco_0469251 [Tanacetum coccineum]